MTALPSEDDLIARHFAPLAGPGGLGLRDDAALVSPPHGCDLVITKDALVAGVHFFPDDALDAVARKALRVNLSDLAAKGADPLGYLLALAMPPGFSDESLALFAQGLAADGQAFSCPLLGGDTVRTPGPLTISVTALGSVPRGRMVPRTGVRPGDCIFVTGTIGDSALGLRLRADPGSRALASLPPEAREHLRWRYLLPQPRHALAAALRAFASGGMDVSDGLVGDLIKMLRVSGVTARIAIDAVPLSGPARQAIAADPSLVEAALTGGDDYELLVSVPPDRCDAFRAAGAAAGVAVALLATAEAGEGAPVFHDSAGAEVRFQRASFSHF